MDEDKRPICLPLKFNEIKYNYSATIAGWGVNNKSKKNFKLKNSLVEIYNPNAEYNNQILFDKEKNNSCSVYEG